MEISKFRCPCCGNKNICWSKSDESQLMCPKCDEICDMSDAETRKTWEVPKFRKWKERKI